MRLLKTMARALGVSALATMVMGAGPCVPDSPSKFGVNPGGALNNLGIMQTGMNGGFRWARIFVGWSDVQPNESAPPNWDWHRSVLTTLTQQGYSILLVLERPPGWAQARNPSIACSDPPAFNTGANPPRDNQVYGNFARSAAQNLGQWVAAFEVFNEPDHCTRFRGTALEFKNLILGPAFDAIKSVQPQATVIGQIDHPANLDQFMTWGGGAMVRPLDAISVHHYGNPADVENVMDNAATFVSNHGLPGYWLTEFGFAAPGSTGGVCAADGVIKSSPGTATINVLDHCYTDARCQKAFYFTLSDTPTDLPGFPASCKLGLLDANGGAKDAFNQVSGYVAPRSPH